MFNDTVNRFLFTPEDQKDDKWASEMVRNVIVNAKPVITHLDYEKGMNILAGKFPEANLDKIFSGPAMQRAKAKIPGSTVYFFEKVLNALIDDRTNAGLRITVNSLDPQKEEKKKSDRDLLESRKGIESLLNEITQNNGMPPKKVNYGEFHGNIDLFDQMQYDEFDVTDLNSFFNNSWGTKVEYFLQKPLNDVFKINQITRNYDKYIKDIFICLHTWSRVYVDDMEGSVKIEYLKPWEVQVLHATGSNDYKDAQGFNIEKQTNVRGFLRRFGNSFNFQRDWPILVAAATGTAVGKYTCICEGPEGSNLIYGSYGTSMNFGYLLELPLRYYYTEFKTTTENIKQYVKTPDGNPITHTVDSSNPPIDGWEKSIKRYEDTYRAYSLNIGASAQHLIKWGKLYMQPIDGQNDEYSGFSIHGNKRDGVPVVKILEPFWNILNITFKMLEMLINDVKPDGLAINYSSIIKIVEYMKQATDVPTDTRKGIEDFLKMVEESPNIITDTPEGDEGQVLGGGNSGVTPKKNGLNAAAGDLIKIMDWIEQKVSIYFGTQGIEFSEPRDGFKLSIENKKKTRAATAFIDFILLNHLEDTSITILNYVQDISKFKDLPCYKYLERISGERTMEFISSMERSLHRNGVFLDTFNNDIELAEIRNEADKARDNKEISFEQWIVVRSYDDPKEAAIYLAREKKAAEKQRQQNAMSALQQDDAIKEKEFQRAMKIEVVKGKFKGQDSAKQALGFVKSAQINAQSAIAQEQMKQQGQNKRLAEQANSDIDKIVQAADTEAQKSLI